jgi:hypothetical protein
VPEEGVETAREAYFSEGSSSKCEPRSRHATVPDEAQRERFTRLAAKARLLERLLVGDERVLAAELRAELEALAGPVAEVVPLRRR